MKIDAIAMDVLTDHIEVRATGKLTKEFYKNFASTLDRLVQERGKVRILFEMRDFHGWTAGAMWEDVKVAFKHWNDIERLALVGETKWEKGMAVFCKPFTAAKIKYFDHTDIDAARAWVVSKKD